MTAHQRIASSLAALSEKELEVLHLLTAGHTVKSIAVQLGRSEASINERLRDARRKTGVGSSRELARLIDAQENWDKKIDLSAVIGAPHDLAQPDTSGPAKSKGFIAMLIALPIAAAALLMTAHYTQTTETAAPVHAVAARQSPLVGTWSLDVNRIPVAERPAKVTIAFHPVASDTWRTQVEITNPDGTVRSAISIAATDGVAVPVTGSMAFIDSVSLRQPEPGTLVMALGKAGKPVSTRVYAVAKNGKTMTETIIWAAEGIPKLETTYFNRVG